MNQIEVGPWFFEAEYQTVKYIYEADDPPRAGIFVFLNTRLMREEAEAAADRASESAVAEIMDSDLDMAEKVRAAAEQPLDSDRMQADVDAAMNNPANWRRDEGGPETRPDDEYICIEIDPRTGRRPGT